MSFAPEEVQLAIDEATVQIAEVLDLAKLAELERNLLGKSSVLVGYRSQLRSFSPESRPEAGAILQQAIATVRALIADRHQTIEIASQRARMDSDRLDLTEVRPVGDSGHINPVTRTVEELEDIFVGLGFTIADGPEAEDDWHNFTALNLPRFHPSRDMHDTFFVDLGSHKEVVMRTHTSPVQIRLMESQSPPIYSVMPGRVYRNETPDKTHLQVFHQIECLVIDRGITFGHLAGTIEMFTKVYFGTDTTCRLRPAYFPFTEPSGEFDIEQPDGSWLELGGCGMVHPKVLINGGIDPEEFSGFAFGFGIERLAATKFGIADLRELANTDIRILQQF